MTVIKIVPNDWTPELHPRDTEGKFTEKPGSGVIGALDDIRDAVTSLTRTVDVGGESVGASPVIRDAFQREDSELKQAATDALDESFVQEQSFGPDRHGSYQSFNAWREEQDGSLLNGNSADLWGAAIDDTGNENIPEDAPVDAETVDDPLPATQGDDAVTALGDSVSVTRDTLREIFGDSVPVTRGVSGEFADELRTAKENGEEIEITHRALESWSTFPDHAQEFAQEGDSDGVLLTTEVPVERVYGASHTTPGLHEEENEIIAALDSSATYSPDQIHDATDDGLAEAYSRMESELPT